MKHGIHPIICVGENLEQREKDITKEVIKAQIEKDLADFTEEDMLNTIIAYEPLRASRHRRNRHRTSKRKKSCGASAVSVPDLFWKSNRGKALQSNTVAL